MMWDELSEADQKTVALIAQALWHSENAAELSEDRSENRAKFMAEKSKLMPKAMRFRAYLSANGLEIVLK